MRRIVITIIIMLAATFLTGCAGSADAVLRVDLLPKSRIAVGTEVAKADITAKAATEATNKAIEGKVITTAEQLTDFHREMFHGGN